MIYWESSSGKWDKYEYDQNGEVIYWERSSGFWVKWVHDEKGNRIYSENSKGEIVDNRTRPLSEISTRGLSLLGCLCD